MPTHLSSRVSLTVLLGAVLIAAVSGCSSTVLRPSGDRLASDQEGPALPSESGRSGESSAERSAALHHDDALTQVLAEANWIRSVHSSDGKKSTWRWVYPAFDGILSDKPTSGLEFRSHLEDTNPIVAANAAIALARSGDRNVAEVLVEAAGNAQLAPTVRCAAAETLGRIPSATVLLQQLVDEEAARADRPGGRYSIAVHGELILSLGRQVRPADEPRLASALMNPADEVKLAALDAWQQAPGGPFPASGLALQNHSDPRIRARLLPALAQHPSNETLDCLTSAISDPDLNVRCAAIRAMGMLEDDRAAAKLESILTGGAEAERIAAVRALADLGKGESVAIGSRDKEWRVRFAVAEVLPDLPGEPDVALAGKLLDDASAEVQHQTVTAICTWPRGIAEPLLMEVLGRCPYRSQKLAAESLAARWPEGRPLLEAFPFGQPSGTRAPALARVRQAYAERRTKPDEHVGEPAPSKTSFSAGQLASVTASLQLLQQNGNDASKCAEALANLRRFDSALVDMLEYLVDQRGIVLPESIFGELLPESMPDFATVEQLRQSDVQARRRAARQLAEDFACRPPRTLLIHRLADLAVTETDAVVWQYLLAAIAKQDDDQAFRLAYSATCHESAVVRQLACEHLGRHPRPQHAAVLLATLDETSEPLTCAAVEALGMCGRDVDSAPIVELLGSRSELVQIAAAMTLTRLNRSEGRAALERLSYSRNEQTRLRVAQAIGELALAEFVPTLIGFLDDRHGIRLAALNSLSQVADCQEAEIAGLHESDRAEAWRQWAAHRGI